MRRITKLGGYLVGIGAGAVALGWLIKDRLLGPETQPVTPEDAPAFRVAPGPPSVPGPADDDLSDIKGVGPVYRARLEQAGFGSFEAIASAAASQLAAAAGVPEERAEDWRRQAATLAD